MNNRELAEKAVNIANNYKTAYVWGSFGLVASASNMQRMINQYSKNTKYEAKAKTIYGKGYFFDCVGLIKGILWGWSGNASKTYGGASYGSNGVPDISADQMINVCSGVSSDFSNIAVGEAVWMSGHIGIYVGNKMVVEATPSFNNGVQITACGNIGSVSGLNSRTWKKHGRIPYVSYSDNVAHQETASEEVSALNATGTVNTSGSNLNVRSTYSTSGNIIESIPNGTAVKVTARISNGWYAVAYNGVKGYVCGDYLTVSKNVFADVLGHFAESHIKKLIDYGIINGYSDGTFKPDQNITRGEFSVIIMNALEKACGYTLKSVPAFSDISGHFAETAIKKLTACGIVNGFEDGTFKPDNTITRGQAAIIACNMLLYCGVKMSAGTSFSDVSGHYAERHITCLKTFGVINGFEDGSFKPDNEITRGQAAIIIANCLSYLGR